MHALTTNNNVSNPPFMAAPVFYILGSHAWEDSHVRRDVLSYCERGNRKKKRLALSSLGCSQGRSILGKTTK